MNLATTEIDPIVWRPQAGPQKALIDCPYPEILYGGARGGGKTDGVLGKFGIKGEYYGSRFNAVFFRQEMPQADDLIERAKEIYLPLGAEWLKQQKTFVLPRGGRIRFRPLESSDDAAKYQGQNLTDAAVEEAGNYPDSGPIDKLFGALRSVGGVPIQLILTANPGGAGHKWMKERYIDPAPTGMRVLERKLKSGAVHRYVYIPSRVEHNRILLENDPGYVDRLHLVGSESLVKAWLDGDWNAVEGAYFSEFGVRHIVDPFPIPRHWPIHIGADWGHYSPYCVLWGAVSSGKDDSGKEVPYPKGAIIIFKELYDRGHTNPEIARNILSVKAEDWTEAVLDPACFKHDGGPSIAEQLEDNGVAFTPADNSRLAGWSQLRLRLKPRTPLLYISSACKNLIRVFPIIQHDKRKPEDLDTTQEDHPLDALRYLCMSRPIEESYKPPEPVSKMGSVDVNAYVKRIRKESKRVRI